ncbi:MAG: hypothetical protein P4L56_05800 [Candidatus Sulfopaludibacter sp.]|nr:hypothetical protein [Candidatus Sulfopaludibacter sp.]
MPTPSSQFAQRAIGRSPDRLTLDERALLVGQYIALEIYCPDTLPLRRIEAIAGSLGECIRMLKSRGLDPLRFEFTQLHPAT